MKKGISVLLILVSNILGCNDPSKQQNVTLLDSISGQWYVESATLDGVLIDDWNQMEMYIINKEDSIKAESVNQANNGNKIWPSNTKWFLTSTNETTFGTPSGTFIRNDDIDISVFLIEEELHISIHPPREWSYDEDCPDDNYELICREEGMWEFVLTKKI